MGEFVFDHEWAAYATRAGIQYYPKMLVGIPFTPVSGSRFLTDVREDRNSIVGLLGRALMEICDNNELSSVHINFCREDELAALQQVGFIPKIGLQFHWQNQRYQSFDGYLGAFKSDRRNKIRRERRELTNQGISIRALDQAELNPELLHTMFQLYKQHIDKLYYGRQYLNSEFFTELLKRPFPHICPIVAEREGRIIAGTFNIRGSEALYGRYWGAFEEHRYLHFNVCYYAAIEHCIQEGLNRFEAGAGGSFKGLRGLEPAKTYSAHYVRDEGFRKALTRYLDEERSDTVARQEMLLESSPLYNLSMFQLYKQHIDKLYYGRQYLNSEFFTELLKRPFPHICPIVAEREGRIIAGTFNIRGSEALYGRYWGAFEEHRYLHFNVCYYAAIEHCIQEGLNRFEAGAGGSFKGLRGLEPAKTYSAHYVRDEGFRKTLTHYLDEERSDTVARQEMLLESSPLKKVTGDL